MKIGDQFNSKEFANHLGAFQKMGKEEALRILGESVSGTENFKRDAQVYYYLRVLFLVERQDALFGREMPMNPKEVKDRYRYYPIVFIDNMPILVLNGYELGGLLASRREVKNLIRDCYSKKMNFLQVDSKINKKKFLESKELRILMTDFYFECLVNEYTKAPVE